MLVIPGWWSPPANEFDVHTAAFSANDNNILINDVTNPKPSEFSERRTFFLRIFKFVLREKTAAGAFIDETGAAPAAESSGLGSWGKFLSRVTN